MTSSDRPAVPPDRPKLWAAARDLRRQHTDAEALLWSRLKRYGLGVPFRRQHPIGSFIVDFLCPTLGIMVELDGGVHDEPDVRDQDTYRESWLTAHGFLVLRYRNVAVVERIEEVLADIHHHAGA